MLMDINLLFWGGAKATASYYFFDILISFLYNIKIC
jgi:hypothetical protein